MSSISKAERRALEIARRAVSSGVYAGWNPGSGNATVGANTIASLARKGLVSLAKTSAGETIATITKDGSRLLETKP